MSLIKSMAIDCLLRIKGLGNKLITANGHSLLDDNMDLKDLYNVYEVIKQKNKRVDTLDFKTLKDLYELTLREFEQRDLLDIKTINFMDELYPKSLLALKSNPPCLMVKGNVDLIGKLSNNIAVIGSRKATEQGLKVAKRFGEFLAEKNITVVSGLALGVDTEAHRGCLNKQGKTIAVVGNGLDIVYPKSNAKLWQEILDNEGCILSVCTLGTKATPYNLVERDLIQTGLSSKVILVESNIKGGSMHAVNEAFRQKKPVGVYDFLPNHYEVNSISQGNKILLENSEQKVWRLRESDTIVDFINLNEKEIIQDSYEEITLF